MFTDAGPPLADPDWEPREVHVDPEKVMAAHCLDLRRDFAGALDEVDILRLKLMVTENSTGAME